MIGYLFRKRQKLNSTALALSVLFSLPASAGTYVVGLQNFDYYPHYNFTTDYDKGFFWAVLELFAKKSGHKFVYETMPVPRLQKELMKGTVDLIYPDNPVFHPDGNDIESKVYSDDVVRTLSGAIVKHHSLPMNKEDVIAVSLPYGFTPLDWGGREKSGEITFFETKNSLAALQLVEQDKTEAAEVDYFVTKHLSDADPTIGDFVIAPSLPTNIIGFRIATIDESALVDEFNHFLKTNSEEINSLKGEYGLTDPEKILQAIKD